MIATPWSVRVVADVAPQDAGGGTGGARAVRVVARDWPWAPWFAAPCALLGAPLLVWSVVGGHGVEAGGSIVFVAFAVFAAALSARGRRDVVVVRDARGVRVRGTEGAAFFARPVDAVHVAGAVVAVDPFPVPPGAPDLPDRGGELVVRDGTARTVLARAAGKCGAARLSGAAREVERALDPGRTPG